MSKREFLMTAVGLGFFGCAAGAWMFGGQWEIPMMFGIGALLFAEPLDPPPPTAEQP